MATSTRKKTPAKKPRKATTSKTITLRGGPGPNSNMPGRRVTIQYCPDPYVGFDANGRWDRYRGDTSGSGTTKPEDATCIRIKQECGDVNWLTAEEAIQYGEMIAQMGRDILENGPIVFGSKEFAKMNGLTPAELKAAIRAVKEKKLA